LLLLLLSRQINEADSWPNQTAFAVGKQCLVEQYNGYREPEIGQHLNGKRTFVENYADNVGIKLAYKAYKHWIAENGDQKALLGIDYNDAQLFWLSAAQTWCGVYREGK